MMAFSKKYLRKIAIPLALPQGIPVGAGRSVTLYLPDVFI